MTSAVEIPEGLRVLPDGSWRIGDTPVQHEVSLLFFKRHLSFDDAGAFIEEAGRRLPVTVEGPPLVVLRLDVDDAAGTARAVLDDGTVEPVEDLAMEPDSGRFECAARGGRARAQFSRAAHQALLEHAEEEDGRFYLRVGLSRLPIRT